MQHCSFVTISIQKWLAYLVEVDEDADTYQELYLYYEPQGEAMADVLMVGVLEGSYISKKKLILEFLLSQVTSQDHHCRSYNVEVEGT